MNIPILTDEDVARLPMRDAVAAMTKAFQLHGAGTLTAPARIAAEVRAGRLVFTCGGVTESPASVGFRVYDSKHVSSPARDELVAVFDGTDGRLRGVVVGPMLGALRTGAIGGAAIDALARRDSKCLGIIGTGRQARTQLPAALTVRDFERVVVWSRTPQRREAFVKQMTESTGRKIEAAAGAEEVAAAADVLVCSTISAEPLIDAAVLRPGTHVNLIGPKFKEAQELTIEAAERADLLVTDSRAQVDDFGETFILYGTALLEQLCELGAIVSGSHPGRTCDDQISLFYSLGLAGTEVVLANRLLPSP